MCEEVDLVKNSAYSVSGVYWEGQLSMEERVGAPFH